MNEELEALKIFTQRLNDNSIPYMVSGSIAASCYAVPRMTRDIDIVIELREPDIDNFAALFEGGCYVDREMIKNEVRRQGAVRRQEQVRPKEVPVREKRPHRNMGGVNGSFAK